ncbi:MAG: hypothetical protein KatS3mg119_0087 [Rhodothalassiaceae bacterium]|nr:MAG: hypothetical protein KatS3mg119_0087 [Rhodothalassiaceae bacterium]
MTTRRRGKAQGRRRRNATHRQRARLWSIILLPVILALGYGAFWLWVAARLEAAVDARLARLRDAGFAVSLDRRGREGFPFSVGLTFTGVGIQNRAGLPLLATADGVRIVFSPLAPDRVTIHLRAPRLRLGLVAARADAGEAELSIAGADTELVLDAAGLVLLPGRGDAGGIRPERARLRLFVPGRPAAGGDEGETALRLPLAWRFEMALADVGIGRPAAEAARRGERLAVLAAALAWHGPLPLPPDRRGLAAWRDAGGTLELEGLRVQLGEATLSADGTISLDEKLRPLAAFDLTLSRPAALINSAVLHGLLTLEEARLLSARIGSLEKGEPGRPVKLPLIIEDGRVMIDTLLVGRIGPLA